MKKELPVSTDNSQDRLTLQLIDLYTERLYNTCVVPTVICQSETVCGKKDGRLISRESGMEACV